MVRKGFGPVIEIPLSRALYTTVTMLIGTPPTKTRLFVPSEYVRDWAALARTAAGLLRGAGKTRGPALNEGARR